MTRTLLTLLLLISGAATAGATTTLTTSKSYPAHDIENVRIDFGAGKLDVEAADIDEIEVTMTARCPYGGRCEERAKRMRLYSEREGATLVFRLEDRERRERDGHERVVIGRRAPKMTLRFRVPRSLGLNVHMGAGDVEIGDVKGDVKLQMGAGDVDIRKSEGSVRTVDVSVGVGDASLRVGSHRVAGRGFLSKRLRWSEGEGGGRVDVDLGAGDVNVLLD